MSLARWLLIGGMLLLVASLMEAGESSSKAGMPARPNVVLIIADDLGYGEPGCYGGTEIPTPHLDALATDGVRFTNGHVTAPFCAASRAGLLTGRYQTRFGFEFNPIGAKNADPEIGLPRGEKTIADRLRESGYVTALIGKWHLGGTAAYHPHRRGFDEFFGFLHEGHFYVPPPYPGHVTWLRRIALPDGGRGRWMSPDGRMFWSTHMGHREPDYDADNPLLRGSQPVTEPDNLTDAFTREACDFIARHQAQPFFLCLAYNAVHSPLQAPDLWMKKFDHMADPQRRIFAAMLAQLDDGVGRVRAQLQQAGLTERTLVIFLSDNGGPTKELTSSNAPLRGGKGDLLEGGLRVPFLMTWPGTLPSGRQVDFPVSALDIAPTLLAYAGIRVPTSLDGQNLRPLFTEPRIPLPPRTLFWRVGSKQALLNGPWKLIRDQRVSDAWQLYRLSTDIHEDHDLAAEDQSQNRMTELIREWDEWNEQQIKPLWE